MKSLLIGSLLILSTSLHASATAPFKRSILKTIEGTYSTACVKILDDTAQGPGTGFPMVFSGDSVSWGGYGHNLANTYSSSFGILVGRNSPLIASVFDLENPDTGESIAVYGIGADYEGNVAATVTLFGTTPKLGNGCSGPTPPQANLWTVALEHINFSLDYVTCVDAQTGKTFPSSVGFDGKVARIAGVMFDQSGLSHDHLAISDADQTLTFTSTKTDGSQVIVRVNVDKTFDWMQYTGPNSSFIVCMP